ncbi:MAG: MATE family efflux transporter [Candidatus Methanofastidiosa archaeon]|nr:MATE family efflux transporter [Candidatus Methanofastidiosa archaeon]
MASNEERRDKLLSDPKKAILSISIPMIVGMSANTIYNFVDAIWVSGIGADALSAVGLFYPFYFMILALSSAISVGGGVALARKIGSGDVMGAGRIMSHSYLYGIIASLALSIPMLLFAEDIFLYLGAGDVLPETVSYARIMFFGAFLLFFSDISNSILTNQGDARRSMHAMLLGSVLNIILDPIFIYYMDMGIAGAAWATVASYLVASALLYYWIFMRGMTFGKISLKPDFDWPVSRDIFRVGVPASLQTLSFSVYMMVLNGIVLSTGGTYGVAILSTGWRVTSLATLPLIGIAIGVSTVTGAAYGAKEVRKMKCAYTYSIKIGLLLEAGIAILVFLLAPYLSLLFTQGGKLEIYDGLVGFLRIVCLYFPVVSISMFSSSLFNGIGKGTYGLVLTLLRTVVLTISLALLFSARTDLGLTGIWIAIVVANVSGSVLSLIWADVSISRILKAYRQ